jgi:hypothetical protein
VTEGPRILRNRTNYWSGLAVSFGLLTSVLWTDPFGVVRERERESDLSFVAEFLVLLSLASIGAYTLFVRPRLELWSDSLVIRNVLRDVRIPYGLIDEVDPHSGVYLRVKASGRRYTAWGLEKHKFQLVQNLTGVAGEASLEIDRLRDRSVDRWSSGADVQAKFRRPSIPELVLALGWTLYSTSVALTLSG